MPAFYSHFAFGIKGYQSLDDRELKTVIKKHSTVYTIGLLGPDLFFYFLPDVFLGRKKPAIVMHEYKTNLFFENLLRISDGFFGEEREIAYAYIAGFMGHYAMDSVCHPYIYERAAQHEHPRNWHYTYESEMDIFCCRHFLHRYPAHMKQHRLLHLSHEEMKVVCRLAAKAYNRTYHLPPLTPLTIKGAIGCMHITIAFLNDKKGRKTSFAKKLEIKLLGHGLLSHFFVNFNMYKVYDRDIIQFLRLFGKGQSRFHTYLSGLAAYRNICHFEEDAGETGQVDLQRQRLLKQLGNLSYHTGLPCGKPYR